VTEITCLFVVKNQKKKKRKEKKNQKKRNIKSRKINKRKRKMLVPKHTITKIALVERLVRFFRNYV